MADLKLDEIGYWSEIKLDIVKKYAQAYSVIISNQQYIKKHVYIDAFAGAGQHISKTTKEFIPGSPLNALNVNPPFNEYHFIDINQTRVEALKEISKDNPSTVFVYEGDCNKILIEHIFPRVRYDEYRRGLCLLDPYGLHLD
ncbi:MAG TPA: three-Cys-motif partner protein TcmP, partial [Nitrospirota bacterium]